MKTKKKCIHCKKPSWTRGVCMTHYKQIKSAIQRGDYGENEAVEKGLIKATYARKRLEIKGDIFRVICSHDQRAEIMRLAGGEDNISAFVLERCGVKK